MAGGLLNGAMSEELKSNVWIRWKLKEPDSWKKAKEREKEGSGEKTGKLGDLFHRDHIRNTLVGVSLATIGLVTFWGCHIYGKNALMRQAQTQFVADAGLASLSPGVGGDALLALPENKSTIKTAEMTSMAINTIGGGLVNTNWQYLIFGWISNVWVRVAVKAHSFSIMPWVSSRLS